MTDFPFDLVGFDLDGTLLDTSHELNASLNHTLASAGRAPIAPGEIGALVGMGARHMLKLGLQRTGDADDTLAKRLIGVLIDHYEANLGTNSPAFPGLIPALDALADAGVKLAVVTNKFDHLAVKLLRNVGLLDRFETVIGGDTMGPGRSKPKPDPIHEMIRRCSKSGKRMRAAFVGDSIFDVQAAKAANTPCIAVSFGFGQQPAAELGADAVIDHFDDLIPTLRTIG